MGHLIDIAIDTAIKLAEVWLAGFFAAALVLGGLAAKVLVKIREERGNPFNSLIFMVLAGATIGAIFAGLTPYIQARERCNELWNQAASYRLPPLKTDPTTGGLIFPSPDPARSAYVFKGCPALLHRPLPSSL
jgi:hypothetical protein